MKLIAYKVGPQTRRGQIISWVYQTEKSKTYQIAEAVSSLSLRTFLNESLAQRVEENKDLIKLVEKKNS